MTTTPQSNLVWLHVLQNTTSLFGAGKSAELKDGGSVVIKLSDPPHITLIVPNP